MTAPDHPLAGIRDGAPLDQASVYHAVARAAALDAFGRAYERAAEDDDADAPAAFDPGAYTSPDDAAGDDPEYVVATTADGELLVIAGRWPRAGRTCGRLVTPRELLALLLDDPTTTAVWCDEDDGAGLALTGVAVTARGEPMLLVVARSARAVGETEGVTDVEYAGDRPADGHWDDAALDALLRDRDGDAVVLPPSVLAELAQQVGPPDAG
jgi:hypothetical protein